MKCNAMRSGVFGLLAVIGTAMSSHAGGNLPPPQTPSTFVVTVSSVGATATWDPQEDVTYYILTFADTGANIGANGTATSASLSTPINVAQPHAFRLTAHNVGGTSEPAVFNYQPGSPVPPAASRLIDIHDVGFSFNAAFVFDQTVRIGAFMNQLPSQSVSANNGVTLTDVNAGPNSAEPITLEVSSRMCTLGGCDAPRTCSLTYAPKTDHPTFQVTGNQFQGGICTIRAEN